VNDRWKAPSSFAAVAVVIEYPRRGVWF